MNPLTLAGVALGGIVLVFMGFLVAGSLQGPGGEGGPSESSGTIGTGTCNTDLEDGNALTPQQIEDFLTKKRAYVAPPVLGAGEFRFDAKGEEVSRAATEFKVNPAFMIGIFNIESTYTTNPKAKRTRQNRNPGNVKLKSQRASQGNVTIIGNDDEGHSKFERYGEGFRGMAFTLRKFYLDDNRKTVRAIAEKYLTGDKANWTSVVNNTMKEILGGC